MQADHTPRDDGPTPAGAGKPEPSDDAIIVYWRPGCMFCSSLLRRLERSGLGFDRIDIWDDPQGAAFVRSVAGGNETVPTVRIGGRSLVNPSVSEVLDAVAIEVPHRAPTPDDAPPPGPMARVIGRLRSG